ncbi:AMP-binding protein, partial [Oceanobacillus picturae]|uniref:AMP-binding protein n=1 Tax=Oceanobacillus picturae TaxID=171693 RepID=UPI000FF2587C
FEAQVEKTPDQIAVVFEDKQLTYRELNERVNSLARNLREKGVKPDSIVAIMVGRSLEMIVGILGILKAGGAYLPVDPEYPVDRIQYMLKDSGANILLTQDQLKDRVEFNGEVVDLENEQSYAFHSENLESINKEQDLAYVIYTSGSTGKPKGVMIEHHSVLNRINWMQSKYPISSTDVILQKTPFTFDVSV